MGFRRCVSQYKQCCQFRFNTEQFHGITTLTTLILFNQLQFQVFCSHLSGGDLSGKDLLTALFGGVSVYFNYTGTETCLDYSSAYIEGLDDTLWDYQV